MTTAIAITPACRPKLARGVKMKQDNVRNRTILLAPERTVALDETGVAILSKMDGERSLEAIAETLSEIYGAPKDVILQDATVFLQDLADRRYLELV